MASYNKILFFLFATLCLCWIFAACDEDPASPTKTDLLTQADWRLVSLKVDGAEQPITGYSLRFTKTAEGAGNYTAAGELFTFPTSGTWAFDASATAILLNGGPSEFRVVSLQQNSMTLEVTQATPKNGDVDIQLGFGK